MLNEPCTSSLSTEASEVEASEVELSNALRFPFSTDLSELNNLGFLTQHLFDKLILLPFDTGCLAPLIKIKTQQCVPVVV